MSSFVVKKKKKYSNSYFLWLPKFLDLFSEMSVCIADSSHLITFGPGKYSILCLNLLMVVAWRLKNMVIISLYLWHTFRFILFLFSFFILSINETQAQLVLPGLIARLFSNHIWVFFDMWAIFIISMQQWPLEFQNHFLSPSWCPYETQKHKHLRDLWASSHLLA